MKEEFDNPEESLVKIEADGKEYVFEELHRVEIDDGSKYQGRRYIALIPIDENEFPVDEDDGNVFILRIVEDEDGEQAVVQIDDDDEFEYVGNLIEDELIDLFADDEDTTVEKRNQ